VDDFLIIGSGFGGSVSALRLAEKGYSVRILEKGQRFADGDFPKSNWNLKRWLWLPEIGFRGLFKMTFLRHVTVLSGVGVGGGSLVYANTLPVPGDEFFAAPSWSHLADWKNELSRHYDTARRMLGVNANTKNTFADDVMKELAAELGISDRLRQAEVGVYFGEPGVTVPDPYFNGRGPERRGCIHCGACMIGCPHGAKNTLDKNYLYLAEGLGAHIDADTTVRDVRPADVGYEVRARKRRGGDVTYRSRNVIFAGGVLGTVPLLLALRERDDGLPRLSPRLGEFVRTNSEVLVGVTTERRDRDFSEGVAITSFLQTDERSHLEPVRYPRGSGFFRLMAMPHAPGQTFFLRIANATGLALKHPWKTIKALLTPDFGRFAIILLYMRTDDGRLAFRLGRTARNLFRRGIVTEVSAGAAPTASIPEATDLAHRVARIADGYPMSMATETILGIPTTAHILGGCAMGRSAEEGVIDDRHQVFGYPGLYVIDGSAVSANPGVNPSLTICALAERAMSFIPPRTEG
jgi:cholesterol oxidase